MTTLVRTELLKLSGTRGTWVLLAVAALLVVARVQMVLSSVGHVGSPASGSDALALSVLGASGIAVVVLTLLGVLTVSGEYHHATLTWTLLATSARGRVLAAKTLAASLVSVTGAAVFFVIAGVMGLASGDVSIQPGRPLLQMVLGGLGSAALWAWFGVAVGALVRNQTIGLLVPIMWLLVVETLVPSFGLRGVVPWLPGGATASLTGSDVTGALPAPVAALVLLAYGSALTALALRRFLRSDVS